MGDHESSGHESASYQRSSRETGARSEDNFSTSRREDERTKLRHTRHAKYVPF